MPTLRWDWIRGLNLNDFFPPNLEDEMPAYLVQERWFSTSQGFRWCVIDRNNEIVIHSAQFARVRDYADELNERVLGQAIPGDSILRVDTEAARVL